MEKPFTTMLAADMLHVKSTFCSAHSQNTLFNSAVGNELPKLNNKDLSLYDTFRNKLRSYNPLEKQCLD